jgi:hypothetical protein
MYPRLELVIADRMVSSASLSITFDFDKQLFVAKVFQDKKQIAKTGATTLDSLMEYMENELGEVFYDIDN